MADAASSKNWDQLAARVVAGGVRALRQHCPGIVAQLERLSEVDWPLGLWGTSHNYDERARERIVAAPVLRALGSLADCKLPVASCHAGLLHTYGYLFSTIDTPFGRKRERWTKPGIESGFGFNRPCLRPEPEQGTLLHNLSWFLARIAWRDDDRMRARLQRHQGAVARSVLDHDYDRLSVTRVTESARRADRTLVEVHTELVAYPERAGCLLVYWFRSVRTGRRLLTAFPIGDDAHARIAALPTGRVDDVRVHYNGDVDGLAEPRSGRRQIVQADGVRSAGSRAGSRSRTARR